MRAQDITISSADVALTPAPIHPEWILQGNPASKNIVLSKSRDGTAVTLLWDCTSGIFTWFYDTDETVYVLEGGAALTYNGQQRRIGAGDVVFFPAGSVATWHVERYIRKLAFFRHALPLPLGLAVRAWHKFTMRLSGGVSVAAKAHGEDALRPPARPMAQLRQATVLALLVGAMAIVGWTAIAFVLNG